MVSLGVLSESFIGAFLAFLFMYLFFRISQGSDTRSDHTQGLRALFNSFNHIHCILDSNIYMMKAIQGGNQKNESIEEVHFPMNRVKPLKYNIDLLNGIRDTALSNLVFRQCMYLDSLNTDLVRINTQLDRLEQAYTSGSINEALYKINLNNLISQFPIVIPYCEAQMSECAQILGHISARSTSDSRWFHKWFHRVSKNELSTTDISTAIEQIKRSVEDVTNTNRERIQTIENRDK